jgi:hypothetical protein
MHKYNNHVLWRTYLFIVLFSITAAGAFLYLKWLDIKHAAGTEQTYANNLVSNSMETLLRKNETMLKILGLRLVELLESGQTQAAQLVIDSVLTQNKELAGVGLVNPQGDLILTSSNLDRSALPNLLSLPESAETFKHALNSEGLVMGRTYFMTALSEWLMPVRVPIFDNMGNVVAVMTTGFRLGKAHSLWSSDNLPEHLRLTIVRRDMYRQYISYIREDEYQDWYGEVVEEKFVSYVDDLLQQQSGLSLSDIRMGREMATIILPNKLGEMNLATISYDPLYAHYTILTTKLTKLLQQMISPSSWLIVMLIMFNIGLYWVFRINIRMQSDAKASLQFQVEHDPLTTLPNRRFLSREFQQWLDIYDGRFSVLFIDLNNFKASNDLHGHSTGDQILCEVASRILSSFNGCLCVRQGGD